MLVAHAKKILSKISAEPRVGQAKPVRRALRPAAASPQPVAPQPALGVGRRGGRDVRGIGAGQQPGAVRRCGAARGGVPRQSARRGGRHALHQPVHHRAALRHRLWNRRVIRRTRRGGAEPCARDRLVAPGRVDTGLFRLGAGAWQAARGRTAGARSGTCRRRLRIRPARLARAGDPRLAQAPAATRGKRLGVAGALQMGELSVMGGFEYLTP